MAITVDSHDDSVGLRYALASFLDGMGGYNFVILDRKTGKIKKYVAAITAEGTLSRYGSVGKEFADAVGIQIDSKGRIKLTKED